MAALCVLVAPAGPADGVLDVLQDLSALGLLSPFIWVRAGEVVGLEVPALHVRDGRLRGTSLQRALVERQPDRVRVCVLVPVVEGSHVPPSAVGQVVAELVQTSAGSAVVDRLRCVLARPGGARAADGELALEGWHNLVVAPEESAGPDQAHRLLAPTQDGLEIGRHAAPVVAGVLGLWAGTEQGPLDDEHPLPGRTVRLVRAYYRNLDAQTVEAELRDRVTTVRDGLPRPREHGDRAVHVDDVELATGTMGRSLWAKHQAVLTGSRVRADVGPVQPIGAWAALKMLFGFLAATLRNAPLRWYTAAMNRAASSVASSVHATVFGTASSAYEVVVKGVTASGVPATWREVLDAGRQLDDALLAPGESRQHEAPAPLGPLWQDYCAAALTLADGGLRDPALPPVQVGAARGVLRSVDDCVPGASAAFVVPGFVAASVGTDHVAPVDVLGARALSQRLDHLARDESTALEADRVKQGFLRWQAERSRSFGVQVGSTLGRRVVEVGHEVRSLLMGIEALARAGEPDAGAKQHQRRLARLMQVLLAVAAVLVVVLLVLAGLGMLALEIAVGGVAGVLLLSFGTAFTLFLRGQRELFRELNRRRAAISQLEATRTNLRQALRDQRRLGAAYEQFLVWSAVLGAFLEEPFGTTVAAGPDRAALRVHGLPMTTRTGTAVSDPTAVADAAAFCRRDLFATGWLTEPFDTLLREAPDRLGPEAHDLRGDVAALFGLPAREQGALLRQWADSLATTGVGPTSQAAVWKRALSVLDGPGRELRDRLVARVLPSDGSSVTRSSEFFAGTDEGPAEGGRAFDGAVLTVEARMAGRGAVERGSRTREPNGLGLLTVLVQLGRGMPSYDLALGAPGAPGADARSEAAEPAPEDQERPWDTTADGWVF